MIHLTRRRSYTSCRSLHQHSSLHGVTVVSGKPRHPGLCGIWMSQKTRQLGKPQTAWIHRRYRLATWPLRPLTPICKICATYWRSRDCLNYTFSFPCRIAAVFEPHFLPGAVRETEQCLHKDALECMLTYCMLQRCWYLT